MDLNKYQKEAKKTAFYPKEYKVIYPALGLGGEAGEVLDKVKKRIRDITGQPTDEDIGKELGDTLWYVAVLASDLGFDLNTIAKNNIKKLKDRQKRNKLGGSGDNR